VPGGRHKRGGRVADEPTHGVGLVLGVAGGFNADDTVGRHAQVQGRPFEDRGVRGVGFVRRSEHDQSCFGQDAQQPHALDDACQGGIRQLVVCRYAGGLMVAAAEDDHIAAAREFGGNCGPGDDLGDRRIRRLDGVDQPRAHEFVAKKPEQDDARDEQPAAQACAARQEQEDQAQNEQGQAQRERHQPEGDEFLQPEHRPSKRPDRATASTERDGAVAAGRCGRPRLCIRPPEVSMFAARLTS